MTDHDQEGIAFNSLWRKAFPGVPANNDAVSILDGLMKEKIRAEKHLEGSGYQPDTYGALRRVPDEKNDENVSIVSDAAFEPQTFKTPISIGRIDPRFVQMQDKSKECWSSYNEMLQCKAELGPDHSDCGILKANTSMICPDQWVKQWDELRENNNWYGYGATFKGYH